MSLLETFTTFMGLSGKIFLIEKCVDIHNRYDRVTYQIKGDEFSFLSELMMKALFYKDNTKGFLGL